MPHDQVGRPTPAYAPRRIAPEPADPISNTTAHRRLLRTIIAAFDSRIVRAYCHVRFQIINLNMLQVLAQCLQDQRRVLEIGCGFGLFGCYFASRDPSVHWTGIDLDDHRIATARDAAAHLKLSNVKFDTGDAREPLRVGSGYDTVLMMDLLHHLPDASKHELLRAALSLLAPGGRLIIKDVTRRPVWKMFFTWVLDVGMTRGFDMWYWSPSQVKAAIGGRCTFEMYPVSDWLPYPHVIYVVSNWTSTEPAAPGAAAITETSMAPPRA